MWMLGMVAAAVAGEPLDAESLLAAGHYEAARKAAKKFVPGTPEGRVARWVEIEVYTGQGRLKSAILALRAIIIATPPLSTKVELVEEEAAKDWAILAIADVYRGLDRRDDSAVYSGQVRGPEPWGPEGAARHGSAAAMCPRRRIGVLHELTLPDERDRWFEPELFVEEAAARRALCLPDAASRLAEVDRSVRALDAELEGHLGLDDAALFEAWSSDPEWPDPGIRYIALHHPLASRATTPELGAFWARQLITDARVGLARAKSALEQLGEPPATCEPGDLPAVDDTDPWRPHKRYPHEAGDFRYDDDGHYWYAAGWSQKAQKKVVGCVGKGEAP